jgi:hypothetical protein
MRRYSFSKKENICEMLYFSCVEVLLLNTGPYIICVTLGSL